MWCVQRHRWVRPVCAFTGLRETLTKGKRSGKRVQLRVNRWLRWLVKRFKKSTWINPLLTSFLYRRLKICFCQVINSWWQKMLQWLKQATTDTSAWNHKWEFDIHHRPSCVKLLNINWNLGLPFPLSVNLYPDLPVLICPVTGFLPLWPQ